jgi:hypothetical protein
MRFDDFISRDGTPLVYNEQSVSTWIEQRTHSRYRFSVCEFTYRISTTQHIQRMWMSFIVILLYINWCLYLITLSQRAFGVFKFISTEIYGQNKPMRPWTSYNCQLKVQTDDGGGGACLCWWASIHVVLSISYLLTLYFHISRAPMSHLHKKVLEGMTNPASRRSIVPTKPLCSTQPENQMMI